MTQTRHPKTLGVSRCGCGRLTCGAFPPRERGSREALSQQRKELAMARHPCAVRQWTTRPVPAPRPAGHSLPIRDPWRGTWRRGHAHVQVQGYRYGYRSPPIHIEVGWSKSAKIFYIITVTLNL
jgi:hypothetical protein